MDTEVLISAIYKRSAIWDKRNKLHFNRHVVEKSWKEIASEMNEDENKLRKKWKYLRDQFGVEFGKIPPVRSGNSGESAYTSKWPYFKSLHFLKDIAKPRLSTGNLPQLRIETNSEHDTPQNDMTQVMPETAAVEFCNEDTIAVDVANDSQNVVDVANNSTPQPSTQSSSSRGRKRKYGATSSFNDALLDIEKQKLLYLQEKQNQRRETNIADDHEHIFKSLLPFVRQIPRSRLLSFRNRVQSLVDEYTSSNETLTSPTTPQSITSIASPGSYISDQHSHSSSNVTSPNVLLNLADYHY